MKTVTDKNGISRLILKKGKCCSCAFEMHWQEYGIWFADCNLPLKFQDKFDFDEFGGKIPCPFWKRKPTVICLKHKIESIDVCNQCQYEFEEELNELEKVLE